MSRFYEAEGFVRWSLSFLGTVGIGLFTVSFAAVGAPSQEELERKRVAVVESHKGASSGRMIELFGVPDRQGDFDGYLYLTWDLSKIRIESLRHQYVCHATMKFENGKLVGIFLPFNKGRAKADIREACQEMFIDPLEKTAESTGGG